MNIIVASKNPVKIRSTELGFQHMFPGEEINIQGKSVDSGVSCQPLTDDETFRGAETRALEVKRLEPDADYWVGIEGGIHPIGEEISAFAWVYITSASQIGKGRTSTFFLPEPIAQLIHQGYELGEADDIVFGRQNSKQENGAVGLLTGDVIDRVALYEQAVVMALIPFKNPTLYKTK